MSNILGPEQQSQMNADQLRQLYIIRQSQLERTLEFCQLRGFQPTLDDLTLMAERLTKYVMTGRYDGLGKTSEGIENHFKENK